MCDHDNREAAMTVVSRDPDVWCDPCIAPLVEALQPFGTVWSCCGHGRLPATIGLGDGRQVIVVADLDEAHRVHRLCWPDVTINDRESARD